MPQRARREKLFYFALVPAIVLAVLVLGVLSLRTTLQIERARRQTVFDATLTLADERVDGLDKLIIAQDNVVAAHVDLQSLSAISRRWLPTAARETPTVRAILVLDMDHDEHDVLAFASRAPGPEDDAFRRVLVTRLFPQMNFGGAAEELRHLHHVLDGQSLLISYWQRTYLDQRYLVVAWHDVPRLVHDVMPRLYRDIGRGNSRMNVVDEEGRIVFGPPIKGGEFTVGRPFPTTLYNWRLQAALASAEQLGPNVERQRVMEIGIVGLAALVAITGVVIVVLASVKERRLAALKSDFVANVSHELKTPLALVRMFGEMLLSDRVASEEKRRQYLGIIVAESERLTALIENVLDFAKVERGKAAYEFAPAQIGEVVARAVDVYRYRAEREGMEVSLRVADPLPPAMIDARAVELAVINLLDNALKYAKEGGRVDVEVSRAGKWLQVSVSDRGPGIAAEDQARIFERFVRGRHTNDGETRVRGSGIGLALVKHIAESHGGRVRVLSPVTEDGRGSAFELAIPALPEKAAGAPVAALAGPEEPLKGEGSRTDPAPRGRGAGSLARDAQRRPHLRVQRRARRHIVSAAVVGRVHGRAPSRPAARAERRGLPRDEAALRGAQAKRREGSLGEWQRLARSLSRMSDAERLKRLNELCERYGWDVAGNFNPRVFQVSTRLLPPLVTALLAPRAFATLAQTPSKIISLEALDDRVLVQGPIEKLQRLVRLGTAVYVPTHLSNMDSIVFGYALERAGLPPATYGAGKNLFTNPILSFFMHNLGAYRVDRRIRHNLYKDVLKTYSGVLLERGYHSLFFPGGTRSRSGGVERHLKLGLVGSAFEAYARTLMAGKERRIFFVPATINYLLTLEAETLIADFLSEAGKGRFIIDDDEVDAPRPRRRLP